jgi:hypothetical protein
MIVRPATDDDVRHVCLYMRAHNARELFATRFHADRGAIAEEILARSTMCIRLEALCADNGEAVALAGAWLVGPGVAAVQMLATDAWPAIARAAMRHLRRTFIATVLLPNVRRAETRVLQDRGQPLNWLGWLGFRIEGPAHALGKAGEDFVHLAWIHPDPARLTAPPPA